MGTITNFLLRHLPEAEIIGNEDCPIMRRWTLLELGERLPKVLLHYFPPNVGDRDPHDHPRSFTTVVLAGGYDDLVPCWCTKPGAIRGGGPWLNHDACGGTGMVLGNRMRAGSIRYRRAEHVHITRARENGAWTVVFMAPVSRTWGFWRKGSFWPWRTYHEEFGEGMKCE
jgi:hypothetical protein